MLRPAPLLALCLIGPTGCAMGGSGRADAGPGGRDAGPSVEFDSGPSGFDAGPGGGSDAGPPGGSDAGPMGADAGAPDAGAPDAGPSGAGLSVTPGFSMTVNGDTTGGPTWARPLASGGCPASGTSSVGTMVPYDEQVVTNVSASTLTVTVGTTASYDGYLIVYAGTAIPADPLMCLAGDDDGGAGTDPMLSFMLAPGESAVLVQSGFDNADVGPYAMMISAS